MDNLTHTLVGLALGELVERALPAQPEPGRARTRRRVLLATGALASNFPDLDLVFTPLLAAPLGYLLHHRGHTHTLLYALPQIALLLGLMWLLWPGARRLLASGGVARHAVLATAALAMLLHLALDALNVYGVHPFYPLDARWLYGDMVFIVEPVFWTALGVALALQVPRRMLRWLLTGLLLAAPVAFTALGFLQWGSLAGLLLLAAAVALAARRDIVSALAARPDIVSALAARPDIVSALPARRDIASALAARRGIVSALAARPDIPSALAARRGGASALAMAILACTGFVAVQGVAGHLARAQIQGALALAEPGSRVRDMALSAFPANPLCWSFATVTENGARGSYAIRLGVLSLAPGVTGTAGCPARFGGTPGTPGTLGTPGTPDATSAALAWKYRESGSLDGLRGLQRSNCQFDAWLRFARIPSLDAGKATDLRFSAPGVDNFSTLPYAALAGQPCPAPVPQWGRPRADLLGKE